jgi:hypothetical protein
MLPTQKSVDCLDSLFLIRRSFIDSDVLKSELIAIRYNSKTSPDYVFSYERSVRNLQFRNLFFFVSFLFDIKIQMNTFRLYICVECVYRFDRKWTARTWRMPSYGRCATSSSVGYLHICARTEKGGKRLSSGRTLIGTQQRKTKI